MSESVLITTERKTLAGVAGWTVTAFEIAKCDGRYFFGNISVESAKAGARTHINWSALYQLGDPHWRICNTDTKTAKLHELATVNEALMVTVTDRLDDYRLKKKRGSPVPEPASSSNGHPPPVPTPPQGKNNGGPPAPPPERAESGAPTLVRVKVKRMRPFADQPRKYFDEDTLGALADSLLQEGQQTPLIVIPVVGNPDYDYELVDGERRWRAAEVAGIAELDAVVKVNIKDALSQHLASTIHSFHRDGHTAMEISNALQKQMDAGKSAVQLAVAFGKSVGWVYQHLALQRLAKPLQMLLDPPTPQADRLRMPVAAVLLRLPTEKQEEVYQKVCNERNPKLQIIKTQALVEATIGISAQKKRAVKPADHVKWLILWTERLDGDVARASQLTPAVFASLLNHREKGEVDAVLAKIEATQSALTRLTGSIARVREALEKKTGSN